jgi:hypothetical protein
MAMQQNNQRKRAHPARPGDISFDIPPSAWIKEADGLLSFECAYLLIGHHSNVATSEKKQQG